MTLFANHVPVLTVVLLSSASSFVPSSSTSSSSPPVDNQEIPPPDENVELVQLGGDKIENQGLMKEGKSKENIGDICNAQLSEVVELDDVTEMLEEKEGIGGGETRQERL